MPRQRTDHSRIIYVFPDDFPDDFPRRLERFREESALSWAELARRLGTNPQTVYRWWKQGVQPHFRHLMALLDLAEDLGLRHLFTAWTVSDDTRGEVPAQGAPLQGPGRNAALGRGVRERRS